jgi:hypothetical protein
LLKIFHPNIIGGNKRGKNIKFADVYMNRKRILELCKKKVLKFHSVSISYCK